MDCLIDLAIHGSVDIGKTKNKQPHNTLHQLRSSLALLAAVLGFRGATTRRSTTLRSPRESSSTRIRSYGLAQRQMQPPLGEIKPGIDKILGGVISWKT